MVVWERGRMLGKGSYGTVSLASVFTKSCSKTPLDVAVKSSLFSKSSSLQKEMKILFELQGCPRIVRCLGNDITFENELIFYNVFLEYIPGGSLADVIDATSHGLPESNVRNYTRSILLGLSYIHKRGYVHCDIKPQNLLVCSSSDIKIADFGLSKKAGVWLNAVNHVRGTPLYVAPESVGWSEYEPPADIWALGCVVVEMAVRRTAWEHLINSDIRGLLFQIGFTERLPEIPECLSEEGKDFLSRCFIKDPHDRWTAKMLLDHPFIMNDVIRDEVLSVHNALPSSGVFMEEDFIPLPVSSSESSFEISRCGSNGSSIPSLCRPCLQWVPHLLIQ
ncbi:mitogen-activated protein kinase kinase kinase 20-like [Magnolia sinica]|uniref:mitogen-activated protein kinase kinase kinase 20-like n=1 Tax=Magnolia sinica TaxID=86752 RepID=UPI00265B1DAF|nr:mitogen-activated protein kinase kinase kinase 20-like [Magnolia sinica]